jgi:predicted RNA methylase
VLEIDDVVTGIRARLRPRARIAGFEDRRFDRRYALDTGGVVEPTDLDVVEGDPTTGFTYVATPVRVARSWLRVLPGDPREFTFVDLGAGKGRVLAIAAGHGFRRVVGVEFASELHDAARGNARAAAKHGIRFETRLGDAGSFEFPAGPLVVHLNNPFAEPVMRRVLENLESAYATGPAPIVVVYQQQAQEEERHRTANIELLDDTPFLQGRTIEPRGWFDRRMLAAFTIRIYESEEAARLREAQ